MWVCLNDAFLSIVSKDCARDELLVRARRAGDIEKIFPGTVAREDRGTDYLYRAAVKRTAVEDAMIGEVRRITYPNFKDSVDDEELHDAYMRLWVTMLRLQPGGFMPRDRQLGLPLRARSDDGEIPFPSIKRPAKRRRTRRRK